MSWVPWELSSLAKFPPPWHFSVFPCPTIVPTLVSSSPNCHHLVGGAAFASFLLPIIIPYLSSLKCLHRHPHHCHWQQHYCCSHPWLILVLLIIVVIIMFVVVVIISIIVAFFMVNMAIFVVFVRAPLGARAYPWILSKYFLSVRASVRPSVRLSPYRLA